MPNIILSMSSPALGCGDDLSPAPARPIPARSDRTATDLPFDLKVTVEKSFGAPDVREKWDRATAQAGGTVYMSYDWCRTWWQFYGGNKELRIFFCRANDELIGILPLYIDVIGIGPFRFRIARLIGASIPPKAFNPPVTPDCASSLFTAVLDQLLNEDLVDIISIGPVSEACAFLKEFETVARERSRLAGQVTRGSAGLHTVFNLPATMEDFFGCMDKDERKKRKYEMRLLSREKAMERDVLSEPARVEAEFQQFAELHASQWKDKGKLGHFGSWPRGREYNLALVQALSRLGRVRFVRILSEGQVISSQYAFVFGDTWYWELPARLMDRQWNRYSLGTSGFFSLVEEAIKEGGKHIEAGIAHYDYKQKLGGTEHPMEVLRIVSSRSGSRLRVKLYGAVRKCLELLYYKIWYSRVSPRLPAAFRKPIWSFWLRLDF
jgi:CelD/BcsL family acetyltransferase involved in cellulose biosynthesis